MTIGDGLACLACAAIFVGTAWAVAWPSVRLAAIRAEALRNLSAPTWTTKRSTRSA